MNIIMRSQGCTIQQALTPEASTIVKQAINLAKCRRHAQVTPLHVATAMFSVSSGLLRAACLQAHTHPLQCRALELCFNVALNRLPTSSSSPILGPHPSQIPNPILANALVAAFKRAQAHQRRGSVENQQQPLLAVKIEVDQLIISILDDPSVSRVMREAGFSSTLVKSKVEQATSSELLSQNSNNSNNSNSYKNIIKIKDCISSHSNSNNSNESQERIRNEDVARAIESLVMNGRRRKNSVVVGECITTMECLVQKLMYRIEKNDVNDTLKGVKFVNLSFTNFGNFSRVEVEQKIEELKSLVKSYCMGGNDSNKGLILYLNDLKWVNEFRVSNSNRDNNDMATLADTEMKIGVHENQATRKGNYYCPIEHMIMEIGKLVVGYGECGKLWLLGIATFQTYMRCKSGNPSLETLWALHAITLPADSLGLSLILDSGVQCPLTNKKTEATDSDWLMFDGGHGGGRIDDTKSRQSTPCNSNTTNTTLPPWLQQYKDENTKRPCNITIDKDFEPSKGLCKSSSTIYTSFMHTSPTTTSSQSFKRSLSFSPSSSTSNFSYDPMIFRNTHQSFANDNKSNNLHKPTFTMSIGNRDNNDHPHQWLTNMSISSNPNSTPTSNSSSDCNEPTKEYNEDNLKALCNALEQKVPMQKNVIFDIASTILHCRSGLCTRKANNHLNMRTSDEECEVIKQDTWLFFQGFDVEVKEIIAKEIARLIFGSKDKFVSIGLSNFSSTTRVDSLEDPSNKRLRDEHKCAYIDRFFEAVSTDNHRVFFVEDIDQVDYCSQMRIKKAMERGKFSNYTSGEEINFGDAIIILSCESYKSKSRACSPIIKRKIDDFSQENDQMMMESKGAGNNEVNDISSCRVSLDLNISINEDDNNVVVESLSMDEIGLLASVDKCVVFKQREELL